MNTTLEAPAAVTAPPGGVLQLIPVKDLLDSPFNPRQRFGKDAMKKLTESVMEYGILDPLTARPTGPASKIMYELIKGHRRKRAALAAGLATVPVLIREMTDLETMTVQLIELEQSADVHPLEQAQAYQRLKDAGQTVEQIASSIGGKGMSREFVYRRLKLCSLIPQAKDAFLNSRFPATHADPLARLTALDQRKTLAYLLYGYQLPRNGKLNTGEGEPTQSTVRQLNQWIAQNCHLELSKAPFPLADAMLYEKAGACTTCPKNTAVNRDIFADTDPKTPICTDGACYGIKTDAFVKLEAETKEKEYGQKILKVSTTHNTIRGLLSGEDWRLAASGACGDTHKAMIAQAGYHEQKEWKLGDMLDVCTNYKCKSHWQKPEASAANPTGNPDIAKHQAQQKEEKAKDSAIHAAQREAARQVIAKTKWVLRPVVTDMLIDIFAMNLFFPEIAKAAGVDLKKLEREALKAATKKPAAKTSADVADRADKKPVKKRTGSRGPAKQARGHVPAKKKGKHEKAKVSKSSLHAKRNAQSKAKTSATPSKPVARKVPKAGHDRKN